MKNSEHILDKGEFQRKKLFLKPEEKKLLVDFFALLVEIDRRNKRRGVTNKNEQPI